MGIFPIRKKELKTYGSSDRPFEHWSSNISWRGVSFLLFLMSCLVVRYSVLCIALCSWHSRITLIMHCSTKAELEHQVLVSHEFFLKICSASSLWDLKMANWFISKTAGCKQYKCWVLMEQFSVPQRLLLTSPGSGVLGFCSLLLWTTWVPQNKRKSSHVASI